MFFCTILFAREVVIILKTVTGFEDVTLGQKMRGGGLTANNVRDKAVDYFLTDAGAVPWQM